MVRRSSQRGQLRKAEFVFLVPALRAIPAVFSAHRENRMGQAVTLLLDAGTTAFRPGRPHLPGGLVVGAGELVAVSGRAWRPLDGGAPAQGRVRNGRLARLALG